MSRLIVIFVLLMCTFTVLAEGRDPETGDTIYRVPDDGLGVFCNPKVDCWLVEGDRRIKKLKHDEWSVAEKSHLGRTFICPNRLVKRATMYVYLWSIRLNKWISGIACIAPRVNRPHE